MYISLWEYNRLLDEIKNLSSEKDLLIIEESEMLKRKYGIAECIIDGIRNNIETSINKSFKETLSFKLFGIYSNTLRSITSFKELLREELEMLDSKLFSLVKDQLCKYGFNEENIFKHEYNYNTFIKILGNYKDNISLLFDRELYELLEFVEKLYSIFRQIDIEKDKDKELSYYLYYNDKQHYYLINVSKIASEIREVDKFIELLKDMDWLIKYKPIIYMDLIEKKLYDEKVLGSKELEDILLINKAIKDYENTFSEILSYFIIRKILKDLNILFLCTHNLYLILQSENFIITEKQEERIEIDIPLFIKIFNENVFIPIECKIKKSSINTHDIEKLKILQEELNMKNLKNHACILSVTGTDEIERENNIDIVPLIRYKEWILKVIKDLS
jgi:hypothetical protein